MTQITIDMTRYWELIDQETKLQQDFFTKNKGNYLELLAYKAILSEAFFFRQRRNYLKLIENYLDLKFDPDYFCILFYRMRSQYLDQEDLFEQHFRKKGKFTFQTDSRAKRFSELLDSIFYTCEELTDKFDSDETDSTILTSISEEEFSKEIEKIFVEMHDILNQK